MKKIVVLIAVLLTAISQYGFAQDSNILFSYLALKDALVADNASLAAAKAGDLAKELDAGTKLPKKEHDALVKATVQISGTKDIKTQREQFDKVSNLVIEMAKLSKISKQPLYLMYCPMKKSSWLSKEKTVKNPYYGKSMLACGTVNETLN